MRDYSNFKTKQITKRATYIQSSEILAREFNTPNPVFPMYVGQVNIFKKDTTEYFWLYQNEADWQKYLDFYSDRMNTFRPAIKKVVDDVLAEIDSAGIDSFDFYVPRMAKVLRLSAILRCIDMALQPKLKEFLDEDEIAVVAAFEEETVVGTEERMLLELAQTKGSARRIETELKRIYDLSKWIYYGLHNETPVDFDQYKKQFFSINNAGEKLLEIRQRKENDSAKCQKILSRLDVEQKKLVRITQESAFLKDYNKLGMDVCFALYNVIVTELAKKFAISELAIRQLLVSEVRELLGGEKINFDSISQRNAGIAFVGHPQSWEILEGDEVNAFIKKYIQKVVTGELKGRVASRGIARGTVRIITRRDDFAKMQKGDILVVTNTTPDYVPIMKLAAAIVAEEGGITAHVSVVSREFGIPAIVGISHVTEVLIDGEVVEVDAEKGLVSRI